MNNNAKLTLALAVLIACGGLAGDVQAELLGTQQEEPTPAAQPAQPSEPEAAATAVVEPASICCAPQYCISYRPHHVRRSVCCDGCVEPVQTILHVQDPCTCCPIEVPVCVPGCCTDAPCVTTRRGLFGRTVTEYCWCCGFRVKIIMTRGHDIIVYTYGA